MYVCDAYPVLHQQCFISFIIFRTSNSLYDVVSHPHLPQSLSESLYSRSVPFINDDECICQRKLLCMQLTGTRVRKPQTRELSTHYGERGHEHKMIKRGTLEKTLREAKTGMPQAEFQTDGDE